MSTTLRIEKPIVAPSNDASANGSAITSASTKVGAAGAVFARRARAGAVEHRRAKVDAGHVARRIGAQRVERQVAGAAAQVEDAAAVRRGQLRAAHGCANPRPRRR